MDINKETDPAIIKEIANSHRLKSESEVNTSWVSLNTSVLTAPVRPKSSQPFIAVAQFISSSMIAEINFYTGLDSLYRRHATAILIELRGKRLQLDLLPSGLSLQQNLYPRHPPEVYPVD